MIKKMITGYKASLSKQILFLLVLLIVVPSVVLSLTLTQLARNQLEHELLSQVESVTTMITQVLNNSYEDYSATIDSFADVQVPPGQSADTYIYDRIRNIEKDIDNVLAAFMYYDKRYYNSAKKEIDPTTREWYKEAMQHKGQVVVTPPYIDAISGSYVITFAKTLPDGKGVAGIDVSIDHLNELVKTYKIGEKGYVSLFDQNNVTMSHPRFPQGKPLEDERFQVMRNQAQGSFEMEDNELREYYHFNKENSLGLNVVSVIDWNEINQKTGPLMRTSFLFIVLLLALIALFVWIFMKRTVRPILQLKQLTDSIAQGDLTVRSIQSGRTDEIGQLQSNFNTMSQSLSDVLRQITDHSEQISASSQHLSANSEENVQTIEQVAASMQEIASMSSDMNQSIDTVKQSATQAQQELDDAIRILRESTEMSQLITGLANTGEESLGAARQQVNMIVEHSARSKQEMEELKQVAEEISGVTNFIQDIASQTNLLALNAAIEAARAGQEGRGFAVVADEVRKLADQTGSAAEKIDSLIGEVQNRVLHMVRRTEEGVDSATAGSDLTQSVEQRFTEMYEAINRIDAHLAQVARVSERLMQSNTAMLVAFGESSSMSQATAQEVDQVAAASEEQNASMEEVAASATHLANIAEELQSLVQRFKLERTQ
ncbi:methyl-accepting chemotaxis protein [Brevibacillus sp. M2.1A]|uniref:methyl-accepting chemotaxis protein n=1 Tax=Brevibacillus sp. M2.1A TaxID=2738980 RepID=UPI00156A7B3E|nr:methyl-accepting chemotaxis protein [Brevibacillus sp. M2.1A]MCC8433800.1 methyl-accepting chemotaxis protein [Brevibacillus sp. M2.1A]